MNDIELRSLSRDDLARIHEMCEKEVPEYSFPLKWFERFTFQDIGYDPDLTIVAIHQQTIVGFFMGTIRKALVFGHTGYLKFFVIRQEYQRRGIGSNILKEILIRLKGKGIHRVKIMDCNPDYIWPGLDPRFTASYFFLKKNGFKKRRERLNLHVDLQKLAIEEPPVDFQDHLIRRATIEDKKAAVAFVKKNFLGTWDRETELSFRNHPPTTHLAIDKKTNEVVGFATYNSFFPGSFGPTGILKTLRGKGIGSVLLKWCVYDLQGLGIKRMEILWVVGNTVKFYSKSIGAKIGQVFWTMKKRI